MGSEWNRGPVSGDPLPVPLGDDMGSAQSETARGDGHARLLLVEFLTKDQLSQRRTSFYPYWQTLARENGLEVEWLSVGFDPAELGLFPWHVRCEPADVEALCQAVSDFRPTRIVHNELMAPDLEARIRESAPGAELVYTDDFVKDMPWDNGDGPTDRGAAERELVERVAPDFGHRAVGPTAEGINPVYRILGQPFCSYAARLDRNPAFADVPAARLEGFSGCSFCSCAPLDKRYRNTQPAEHVAMAQIRAILATCPAERLSNELVFESSAFFLRIGPLLDLILAEGLPPTSLYFYARPDWINHRADVIEAALPRLAKQGHRLNLFSVGVESFSAAENERFNKGLTADDLQRCAATVNRWQQTFPDTLEFDRFGRFAGIVFTPWTTLPDLLANIEGCRELGIPFESGFLNSRLLLFRDTPVTFLADRDGLLADSFESSWFQHYRSDCWVDIENPEIPWQFREPSTRVAYVFVQCLLAVARGDELTSEREWADVRDTLQTFPGLATQCLDVFELACRTLQSEPDITDVTELLAAIKPSLAERFPQPVVAESEEHARETFEAQFASWAERFLNALAAHPSRPLGDFRADVYEACLTDDGSWKLGVRLTSAAGVDTVVFRPLREGAEALVSSARLEATYLGSNPAADYHELRHTMSRLLKALDTHLPDAVASRA